MAGGAVRGVALALIILSLVVQGVAAGSPAPLSGPAAPSSLASAAPLSSIVLRLTWTNPVGPAILNNTVYFSPDGGCQDSLWTGISTGGAATRYNLTGLVPDTKYCVAVTAWSSGGQSATADWGNFTTLPGPVQSLRVTASTTSSISMTWFNGGGTAPLVNSTVFHATSCSSFTGTSVGSAVTSYSLSGLAPATKYCIVVCVWNSAGMSPACAWGNFSTAAGTPTNLVASSPYPSQITLTWSNPSGITVNDTIRYGTTCGPWSVISVGAPVTTFTIGGLAAASSYCVSVQSWSNQFSTGVVYANQTTVPFGASGIVLSRVVPSGATVTWTNPAESLSNVSLTWGVGTCSTAYARISVGVVSTYALTGLARGVLFCLSVITWTAGGGGNATTAFLQTPKQLPFAAPTGLHAVTQDAFSVTLGWTNPAVPLSNETIWYGASCSALVNPVSTNGPVSQFRVLGLMVTTNYCWAVQAWNTTGFNSSLSAPIYASTGAYTVGPACNLPACLSQTNNGSGNPASGLSTVYIVIAVVVAATIGLTVYAVEVGTNWGRRRRKE